RVCGAAELEAMSNRLKLSVCVQQRCNWQDGSQYKARCVAVRALTGLPCRTTAGPHVVCALCDPGMDGARRTKLVLLVRRCFESLGIDYKALPTRVEFLNGPFE